MKKGFIDPISLITLGFLIVGLVVTTAIVKNPDIKLDIRNWARMSTGRCPNGAHAPDGDISLCPQKPPAKTTTTTTQTAPAQPPPVTAPTEPAAPLPIPAEPVIGGICCPSNSSQGSINTCKGLPNPTACGNQSVCEWKENLNWADCPGLKPTPPMAGLCCVRDNLSADKLPSANGTCPGASYSGCTINSSLCEWKLSCSSTPPPPATLPPPAVPACGAEWEECCGSYPNGSCNSGLYCSNLDGGTCRTKVCTAERKCEGNVLKICKADGSGWNNTTCQYGCVNNDCQAAAPPPPSPSPTPTTSTSTYPSSNCSNQCTSNETCVSIGYGYYGCQKTTTMTYKIGDKQCSGSNLETWNGSKWEAQYCAGGCKNNACKPAPITKCSSFGSCYPTNYACEKDYGQLNCGTDNKCGGHCSLPSLSPKSSTDYPQEGRYTQQLIPQTTQTCQQAGGDVCLSRRLCLTEEGKIISSSQSDCREEEVCCSFPKKINSETANSKDETDDFTSTSNAAVPSTAPVFFSDQYHELPPSTYLPTQIVPTMIILHWDGQGGSPYGWTTNGTYRGLGFETSAHFAVGIDGVLQMLPMTNTTVARSQGAIGRNDQAINIEMAGWNFDATPPTQKEIDASINLIIKLMQAYHLTINDVFGHSEQDTVNSNGQACVIGVDSDCRDRYKSDPGKEFMDKIRKEVANRLVSQSPAAPEQAQSQTDSTNTTGHYMQTAASINNNPIAEQCLVCIGTDCQTINKPIYMEDVGCGPTAVANILHNYGIEANPLDLAKRIPANQLFCNGSALSAQVNLLQSYGLQVDGPPPSLYSLDKFTDNNDSLLVVGNVNNIDHFTTIQIKEADGQQTLTLIDSYFSDAPLNCRIVSAQELSCGGKNNEGKSVTVSINYETMFIVNL